MTKKIGADWVTNNEFFSFTKLKKKRPSTSQTEFSMPAMKKSLWCVLHLSLILSPVWSIRYNKVRDVLFSASLLNWKFEKGSSHELINSFCLRSGFRRDSFIISDDDSWCLSAQLLFKLLKDLISTCFFSKLKVRWRPASKNQFWFKVIHG